MRRIETAQLVEFLAQAESREFDENQVEAWHTIIGHLDFEPAKQALVEALQEGTNRYLQPREIVARVYKIREKEKDLAQKENVKAMTNEQWVGVPMPKCVHGKGLLFCDPCCRNAAIQAGLIKG